MPQRSSREGVENAGSPSGPHRQAVTKPPGSLGFNRISWVNTAEPHGFVVKTRLTALQCTQNHTTQDIEWRHTQVGSPKSRITVITIIDNSVNGPARGQYPENLQYKHLLTLVPVMDSLLIRHKKAVSYTTFFHLTARVVSILQGQACPCKGSRVSTP